jgi:hypothetical protein
MSLTVPTSGSIAGRSANLSAVPDQTGAIVGQFAEALANVGIGLENDRLSREANRLQVDMQRDFNNLSLELESIGDPDQLEQQWSARSQALRQSYLTGQTEDGRPRVDPRNAERIELAFDDLSDRHAFQIGGRALAGRQSQREATWLAYQQTAANAAAITPDPAAREALIANGEDQIAELVASNTITPEEGQRRVMALRGEVTNAAAIRLIETDPEGFLEASSTGAYRDLGPEAVARYEVQANNAIQARDAEALRLAETATNERNREIAARLTETRQTAQSGARSVVVDEGFLSNPEVQAHPDYAATRAAIDLQSEGNILPQMTVRALETLLAEEEARPVGQAYQAERQQLLRDQLERSRTGWSTDPIAYAAEAGFWVPDLDPFDPANPQAMTAALEQRQTLAQTLVDGGFIRTPRLLTDPERQQIAALAAVDQDPAARVALAEALFPVLTGDGPDSIGALVDDPVFLQMGSYVAAGGNPALAEEAFRGQQVIAQGNVILPPVADRIDPAYDTLAAIYADLPQGEAVQAGITAATDALYAARIRRDDPNGPMNATEYRKALHEVMGGTGVYNSPNALGGVQDVRGIPTILPRGVNGRQADEALRLIGRAPFTIDPLVPLLTAPTQGRAAAEPALAVQHLTAASLTSAPPAGMDDPAFLSSLSQYDVQAIGDDQYRFVFNSATGPVSLRDANGGEYRFSLRRLISTVDP